MARKWLPDNVTAYKDRHGKTRYRYRKSGIPSYTFKSEPGTPEFLEEWHAAKSAVPEPTGSVYAPFTYHALITSFYQTTRWLSMKPSSRSTYRNIIERFRSANGNIDVRRVDTRAIDGKLSSMSATPAAANNLRKALGRLHRHAIKLGWRTDNPVAATDPYKQGKGWHCWTEEEIEQYEARWPPGTREHLAMALLLYTAMRRSDMVAIGQRHRRGDELHLHHTKNDSATIIPILPPLAAILSTVDGDPTYLVTENGKPFTPAGFGNWFRERCNSAGLPHCSAHGLRKAMSRRLAEAGVTSIQGRAVTGHKTDKEFAYYAEQANRKSLAGEAMGKMLANPQWHSAVKRPAGSSQSER